LLNNFGSWLLKVQVGLSIHVPDLALHPEVLGVGLIFECSHLFPNILFHFLGFVESSHLLLLEDLPSKVKFFLDVVCDIKVNLLEVESI